jgi:redox-sensitive bicupin YhaK (pirin superfamily)
LRTGGVQELIQLWINVPKANKWDGPTYQHASKEQLPKVLEQEGVDLRLASGEYEGKTGPLHSHTPVVSIVGEIEKGKRVQFTATPGYWTLLYVAKGSININLDTVNRYNLVVFEKENEEIFVCAEEDSQLLFLSAEPLDEPVAAKGNFVMNTPEEIQQAVADYNSGVFGTLDS